MGGGNPSLTEDRDGGGAGEGVEEWGGYISREMISNTGCQLVIGRKNGGGGRN